MKTLEIKKANKVFSMMPKSQEAGIKVVADQVYESGDGQLISALPNATVKGASKVLVMIYENAFVIYLHKPFKKVAYKFSMDELEFSLVQNKGLKALFSGKSWIRLVSQQMEQGAKPLQFSIGMVVYRKGARYITPNSKATVSLAALIQNFKSVLSSNKGNDFLKTGVVSVLENAKGKSVCKTLFNVSCLEYLLLYENKGYLINDEITEFTSKEVSLLEAFEFKWFFVKTQLLDIRLKGGSNMKLGVCAKGGIAKDSADQLKSLLDSWTD